VIGHLTEYEGKSLVSVAQGDLDLGSLEDKTEKKDLEKDQKTFKKLTERMHKVLEEVAEEVRVTHRLTDSPACLVSKEGAMDANMERLLKSMGQAMPESKRVLEVNPHHPLVEKLQDVQDEERFADWSRILFDQSLLAEGGHLEDPAGFTRRLNGLLQSLM